MAPDQPSKARDATVSNSASMEGLPTAATPTTTKEDRPPGAMSEEAADNTSVESPKSTEELHGETVTQGNLPKCTHDAEPSSTSVRLPAPLLFRRPATRLEVKASRWLATGARRVATLTPLESTRDMDITVSLIKES